MQILTQQYECTRCSGSGELPKFRHIANGVCFACKGSGKLSYSTASAWFAKIANGSLPPRAFVGALGFDSAGPGYQLAYSGSAPSDPELFKTAAARWVAQHSAPGEYIPG